MYTAIIALVLAASPTDWAPPTFDVSDVEVVAGESNTNLTAFDADGEVSVEIVEWLDAEGRRRLDVNFADGLYLSAIRDGDKVTVDSNNAAEVVARAPLIDEALASNATMEQLECGAALVGLLVGCGAGGPWGCLGGAAVAGTYCGPLVADALR
jgi:hypothetical protein